MLEATRSGVLVGAQPLPCPVLQSCDESRLTCLLADDSHIQCYSIQRNPSTSWSVSCLPAPQFRSPTRLRLDVAGPTQALHIGSVPPIVCTSLIRRSCRARVYPATTRIIRASYLSTFASRPGSIDLSPQSITREDTVSWSPNRVVSLVSGRLVVVVRIITHSRDSGLTH